MNAPTVRIERNHSTEKWSGRWYWWVEWEDYAPGYVHSHGRGGWAATRLGARFAAWRVRRGES